MLYIIFYTRNDSKTEELPVDDDSHVNLGNGADSRMFIKTIHHPHSGITKSSIIPLDAPHMEVQQEHSFPTQSSLNIKPWAPFRTLADFTYAESAVTGPLSKKTVNLQLKALSSGCWAKESHITFQNYDDMEKSLNAAREYGVRVRYNMFRQRP